MLTDLEIDEINRILNILNFVNLTDAEIDYLNEIYSCNPAYIQPCLTFYWVSLVIENRGDTCIDGQVGKLQAMGDCNDCNIDFSEIIEEKEASVIWVGGIK